MTERQRLLGWCKVYVFCQDNTVQHLVLESERKSVKEKERVDGAESNAAQEAMRKRR